MMAPAVSAVMVMIRAPSAVADRGPVAVALDHISGTNDRLGLEHHVGERSRIGLRVAIAAATAAPTAVEQSGRRALRPERYRRGGEKSQRNTTNALTHGEPPW